VTPAHSYSVRKGRDGNRRDDCENMCECEFD
jgi:hypothetical protein